jgi:hypothetical protein
VFEQRQLAGEPHDGGTGIRRPRRLGANDEHPAELLLECLDALRHC